MTDSNIFAAKSSDDLYYLRWENANDYNNVVNNLEQSREGKIYELNKDYYTVINGTFRKLSETTLAKNITNDLGTSERRVVSQKTVTENLNNLNLLSQEVAAQLNSLGYTYISIATPSTTPVTLTEDNKVFYIATEEGDYSKFGLGNISELSIIKSDGGTWMAEGLGVAIAIKASNLFDVENSFVGSTGTIKGQTGYKRTDYLPIESLYRVKGWDGGTSHEMKAITFFDAEKTFIGYYNRQSTSGLFDVKLSDVEIPENAEYAIVSQLNDYPTTYWLKNDPNYKPSQFTPRVAMSDTESDINRVYIAIEEGVYEDFGGVEVKNTSLLEYKENNWVVRDLGIPFSVVKLNDFSYSQGYLGTEGYIYSSPNYSISFPIPISSLYRVKGWDDGKNYQIRAISFYDKDYNYISAYDFDHTGGMFDVFISKLNIPEGAEYIILTQKNENPTTYWLKNNSSGDIQNIFKKRIVLNKIAKQSRGAVYVDFYTFKEDKIKISIDWDTNSPFTASSINLYKATRKRVAADKIGSVKKGEWLDVEIDSEYPSIYLYNSDIEYAVTDPYYLQVTIQSNSGNTLDERLEKAETEIEDIKSTNPISWYGKNVVVFGDSITEFRDEDNKTYSDRIAELTFANVINCGIGGTQLKSRYLPVLEDPSKYTAAYYTYAGLDIVNLVRSSFNITKDGINYRNAAINAAEWIKTNQGDNNTAQVNRVNSIDWSTIDAVIIMAGANDWTSGGVGTEESTDINRTVPAIKKIIEVICTNAPHVKIYWFTPIVQWLDWGGTSDEKTENFSDNKTIDEGLTLREVSDMIEKVVANQHISVCNLYNSLGWNSYNFGEFFGGKDGRHPKKNIDIARKMVSFINANKTF